MSELIGRWFMISAIVYFAVHIAVFILRLNGVAIGGLTYGK
jgi:hypothetical protein